MCAEEDAAGRGRVQVAGERGPGGGGGADGGVRNKKKRGEEQEKTKKRARSCPVLVPTPYTANMHPPPLQSGV